MLLLMQLFLHYLLIYLVPLIYDFKSSSSFVGNIIVTKGVTKKPNIPPNVFTIKSSTSNNLYAFGYIKYKPVSCVISKNKLSKKVNSSVFIKLHLK